MIDMIDFCDESRRQIALCKILSSYRISGFMYRDEFSSEYIDVTHQYDDQKTCEWISRE